MVNEYIGCQEQICGVEEYCLCRGRGKGMHLCEVRNGKGLEFTVSPDRCLDVSRLSFKGVNCSFMAPAGYVAPQYFMKRDKDFLKSFTCGFFTTCGLKNVGPACESRGENLPLHGTISNTPADNFWYEYDTDQILIKGLIRDEEIFGDKLVLNRKLTCSLKENRLEIQDRIKNTGDRRSPLMILYHFNVGYPLLSEEAELYIGSDKVKPRDAKAESGMDRWKEIEKPQAEYKEQCFYHQFSGIGKAGVFNEKQKIGFLIEFDSSELNHFTQWKMMGVRDYVMGLEPGNCNPESQKKLLDKNELCWLESGEEKKFYIQVRFFEEYSRWKKELDG